MADGMVLIYSTFGNADEAKGVARVLVEGNLVACANVLDGHSAVFAWKGEVREEREVGVIFKVAEEGAKAAVAKLKEVHPYEVPVIVWWRVDAVAETIAWARGG